MVKSIFSILIAVIIFIIVFVRVIEGKSVFFPKKVIDYTPAEIKLAYEDISFTTSDNVKLNGWFVRSKGEFSDYTLLYAHGNAGNIGDRLEKLEMFSKMGVNVFIFDYRGYGKSSGHPTEKGIYKDVVAAYDYLLKRDEINKEKIISYGVSLGGVAAIDLCRNRKVAGLIVDSSFSSAEDMAKIIMPMVPSFLVGTKMDSYSKVKNMNVPKLFMHSKDDEIIPYSLGIKLFENAAAPKKFVNLQGGHNNNYQVSSAIYYQSIYNFIKSLDDAGNK